MDQLTVGGPGRGHHWPSQATLSFPKSTFTYFQFQLAGNEAREYGSYYITSVIRLQMGVGGGVVFSPKPKTQKCKKRAKTCSKNLVALMNTLAQEDEVAEVKVPAMLKVKKQSGSSSKYSQVG